MEGVLAGIRVVEVAMYAFGPSAGAVLGDWGADVVKVVHPTFGDPMRGAPVADLPARDDDLSFMWEILNRNKRCVAIDLGTTQGRELLDDLVRGADVFLTSFLPESRQRLRIDLDDIRAVNAQIVYARASGQGVRGPDGERGGYDHTSFWCRTGIAHAASQVTSEFIPQVGPAFGDLASGLALAAGVAGALVRRERTGATSVVDASLLSMGMWMFSPGIVASELYGVDTIPRRRHAELPNPLVAAYDTKDGRQIYLSGVRTDAHWHNFCSCIGRPDLVADPRFAEEPARLQHRSALIELLDGVFRSRTLAEWCDALADLVTPWTVVQTAREIHGDPQVAANGYLQDVLAQGRVPLSLVASPIQFDEVASPLRAAPEHGEHTEEVLLELGRSWDDIGALKEQHVTA